MRVCFYVSVCLHHSYVYVCVCVPRASQLTSCRVSEAQGLSQVSGPCVCVCVEVNITVIVPPLVSRSLLSVVVVVVVARPLKLKTQRKLNET